MSRGQPSFTCSDCGAVHRKWAGRCDACGAWNSIVEEAPLSTGPKALGAAGCAGVEPRTEGRGLGLQRPEGASLGGSAVRPGALQAALSSFSDRGINLIRIESRPSHRRAWEYLFFIDFPGHWETPAVQAAIGELKSRCEVVKWLGSYPQTAG